MSAFSRSVALLKASRQAFRMDPSLALYPVISLVAVVLALAAGTPLWMLATRMETTPGGPSTGTIVVFYVSLELVLFLLQFVGLICNSAFYLGAEAVLEGKHLPIRESFAKAWERRVVIAKWAVLATGVGLLISQIAERIKVGGFLTAHLIGMAWNLATLFIVPVLVRHEMGPIEALKYSAGLFRRTWGEKVSSEVSLGFVTSLMLIFVVFVPTFTIAMVLSYELILIAAAIGLGAIVFLAACGFMIYLQSLQTLFTAALYRYAETGDYVGPFTPELIQGAYRPKRK